MDLETVKKDIELALSKGEFVCFYCRCAISYSGRAESYLEEGDRLVAIKQDRTVMIHQPIGGMPINYVKAPAGVELNLQNVLDGSSKQLAFRATSGQDDVFMEIVEVYELFTRKLLDGKKQELSGNEAEMSDMLRDNPSMISSDFIPLSREEHTKYGFIDVFGHLGDGTLAIVECKRYTGGLAAVTQLKRYVDKMRKVKGIQKVTGILAAPAITSNAMDMVTEFGFSFALVQPPKRHVNKRKLQQSITSFFE